ncbi:MAG: DUF2274 domain-containing protein [Sphingomonadaceae bacterium]
MAALAAETGSDLTQPEKLIATMIQRFMATDRAFAKIKRQGKVSEPGRMYWLKRHPLSALITQTIESLLARRMRTPTKRTRKIFASKRHTSPDMPNLVNDGWTMITKLHQLAEVQKRQISDL